MGLYKKSSKESRKTKFSSKKETERFMENI